MKQRNAKSKEKQKVYDPFSMHIEIDFEGITQIDGVYTLTPNMVFDKIGAVFEELKHKKIKMSFRMEMAPTVVHSKTWKMKG